MASHADATRVGVDGLLARLVRADGSQAAGRVVVSVDYASFADAYGGDYASRLRLVVLPACALSTPGRAACRREVPLASSNDSATSQVTATVTLPAGHAGLVVAATSSPSGSGGDYSASALNPAGQWSSGGSAGDFTYSYPIAVPPEPGKLVPSVSLDYDSGLVDGLTSSTNNQPSWVGDGWSYSPGFIQRSYGSCSQNPAGDTKTGDQCWSANNVVTLSLNGQTTTLVDDPATGWHPQNDAGERIQLKTNGSSDDGEYWIVTTSDGTQYYFGLDQLPNYASGDPTTNSVDTEPVFFTSSDQSCHKAAFADSYCQMPYRWNLDYVVDTHNDAIGYFYDTDLNNYGADNGTETLSYVRDTHLDHILYGFRAGQEYSTSPQPAGKVTFSVEGRCNSSPTGCDTSTLSSSTASSWPDVPYDQICTSTCTNNWSPTFFSEDELTGIQTQTLVGSGYQPVDSWALTYNLPDPGDQTSSDPGTTPALWLASITHTGQDTGGGAGGSVGVPTITFKGQAMANRVNLSDGYQPLSRFRLTTIITETGEVIGVDYVQPSCPSTSTNPATNTSLCYPDYWTPPTDSTPIEDWFNKYVVSAVSQQDKTGGGATIETSYCYNPTVGTSDCYNSGGAWHFDDDPLTQSGYRTWDQWRGYQTVDTYTGTAPDPVTETQDTYFRGMDGDPTSISGGTESVSVTDSRGESVPDADQYAGLTREHIVYDGSGGSVVSDVITDPWSQRTADESRSGTGLSDLYAYMTNTAATRTYVPLAAGGTRESQTSYTYDSYGRVATTSDQPDTSTTSGATCTTTSYATNTSSWLLDLPAEVREVSVPCGATVTYPDDAVSDTRTYYDQSTTLGAAPSAGDVTMVQKASAVDSSGNPTDTVTTSDTVDEYGRTLTATNGNLNTTTTAYTPATGAEPTKVTTTDPVVSGQSAGFTSSVTYDPARDLPLTSIDTGGYATIEHYDALGRLTAVWKPGNDSGDGPGSEPANITYAYTVSSSGPSIVTTNTLNEGGAYKESESFYDALLRPIETQTQVLVSNAVSGVDVTQTVYNSDGWKVKTADPYYSKTALSTSLIAAEDGAIPSETGYVYDGDGRQIKQIAYGLGSETWETDTAYAGADSTTVTPPAGGTPTTTITNAEGKTAQLLQYDSSAATGSPATTTSYTYTPSLQIATVTDTAGNTSSYHYDLLGQKLSQSDPDAGSTSYTYDGDGNLASSTDARGKTLSYTYDAMDRKTAEYDTTGGVAESSSNEVASWTYDTLSKGYPTSSTAYVDGSAYTQTILGYDPGGRSQGVETIIPATENQLAGTYKHYTLMDSVTGLLTKVEDDADGGLPKETVGYGYDAFGEPTMVSSNLGNTLQPQPYVGAVTYSAFGQPTQYTFGAGNNTQPFAQLGLTYDPQTQALTESKTSVSSSGTVDDTAYTYNPAGELTSTNDVQDDTGSQATETQCYTYNDLQQLTQAWTDTAGTSTSSGTSIGGCNTTTPSASTLGGPQPYWQSWSYDTDGDRKSETDHDISGDTSKDTTTTYTYPQATTNGSGQTTPPAQPNTLSATTATTGSSSTTTTFGYNADGDTTSISAPNNDQTLTWNDQGRLESDATSNGTTNYVYDADGNLLLQKDPGSTTLYLPDEQLVLDTANNTVTGTRYYSMGSMVVASRTSAGVVDYLIPNRQNTDVLAIDAATLTCTRREYSPFGQPSGGTPSIWPGDSGFVGGTQDPSTGLENLGAREYDPDTGRFLSVDPVLETTDPQQLNGYDYAGNNPVSQEDPTGLIGQMMCDGLGQCASLQWYQQHPGATNPATHTINDRDFPVEHDSGYGSAQRHSSLLGWLVAKVDWGAIFAKDHPKLVAAIGGVVGAVAACFGSDGLACGSAESVDQAVSDGLYALLEQQVASGLGCGNNSFVAGTLVLLADGASKPIQNVRVGDKVKNALPGSRTQQVHTVTAVHVTHTDHRFVHLSVADQATGKTGTIAVTADHVFYDPTQLAWTQARNLKPGDHLQTPTGDTATVTSVTDYTTTTTTYNLTIDTTHDYYVVAGDEPVLVHNDPRGCGVPDPSLGRGSTGRTEAKTLNEQLAMKQAMSDPSAGTVVPLRKGMTDPRWEGVQGWVKMTQNINGIEIHYVYNTRTGKADDFKYK